MKNKEAIIIGKRNNKTFTTMEEYTKYYYGDKYWQTFLRNIPTEDILEYLRTRDVWKED